MNEKKTRASFFKDLEIAGESLRKATNGKPKEFARMFHDGNILSAAMGQRLSATGTPQYCPVSRAITTAAYKVNDAVAVVADFEAAWEHYEFTQATAVAA